MNSEWGFGNSKIGLWEARMKKIFYVIFVLLLFTCTSPQVTEETDCCLALAVTAPVVTDTPIPTPTKFLYPTLSPDEQAKISAFETKMAEYPSICKNLLPYYFSPDGLWRESFCFSEIDNEMALTISNRQIKVLWKMFFSDYIPYTDIVPDGEMAVVHWSKDGRYAYFNSHSNGSGGECFVSGNDSGWGLFRIDLQTGDITSILPIIDPTIWYSFSFSPTDRRLVYGTDSANFKILDIQTGETIDVVHKKELTESGGYVWSSSGQEFIYSTLLYNDAYERDSYTIRLVDAKTGTEKILIESPTDCFQAIEWKDNILKIQKNSNHSIIEFDLNTNTIISETPITP